MNKYKRADRVAALLQEEVSNYLLFEMKNADLGFITITRVRVSDDLRHARIFYSVLGEQERIGLTAKKLEQLTGPIRGEMGHRLGLRYVPEIEFSYDDSAAYAAHIQEVIEKIHREEKS
ncbi:MAG TPA: 30S ribosome-binding factor RbfA [bacterium]|nr:30S ribosome-binding factor RbfA [bacterium]HOY43363.1 30S ribosome-binding factor RbfA [bacterium]HPG82512.1 30S ribosome-binding factor RbfA [bacterium]HPM59069.1 30S ribosome-binding factor RbfA [bacterium]